MPERYFSVDVEANGPIPGTYSMTAIGCVVVDKPDQIFYAELKPITDKALPAAEEVSGLTLDYLEANGTAPAEVMQAFHDWVVQTSGETHRPVFVAFNATFDWLFVHWYFMTFVGQNPFGVSGLDMKAYYMGMADVLWSDTTSEQVFGHLQMKDRITHNALDDARVQAALFEKILAQNADRPGID